MNKSKKRERERERERDFFGGGGVARECERKKL